MKTRSGFVSNSSSSSFIIMGTRLTKNLERQLKTIVPKEKDEDDYTWFERVETAIGLQRLYTEGESDLIGEVLADVGSDGDYLEDQKYSIEDLQQLAAGVIKKLGGGDIEVKLYMGTRPS